MSDFDHELAAAQEEAVKYMLRPESDGAALLAFDMGLGKTRTGLMFAREYGARVVLVVVPLQTVDSWAETAQSEYPDLPFKQINSTTAGKTALAEFQWRTPGIYIVGHEYWERLAWKRVPVKKRHPKEKDQFRKVDSGCWSGGGYLLIFDESHRSANIESWTHKALMNINKGVFKLSMSGTFFGDKFEGAFGATRWLWPHRTDIIPKSIYDWRKDWAVLEKDYFHPSGFKIVGEKVEGAFVSTLPCYLRMESDLPEPVEHNIWLDLYPEQRRVYDELDKKMIAWIMDDPLVTEYSITKRARQRQATLAMPELTFDPETNELVEVSFADDAESAKIDRLISALENTDPELGDLLHGESLLILTDSQKFARLLTTRLNNHFGDVAREWSGPISKKDRAIAKQEFIDGKIKYLVGVQAAMGTGTDGLQHASHIVVQMSRADRRINNDQGIARLNRKGQKHQVHVVNILANDTIDTGQLSAQMEAAIAAKKSMRKKARRKQNGSSPLHQGNESAGRNVLPGRRWRSK
jgi:superfamily II DNA or RNA helicase